MPLEMAQSDLAGYRIFEQTNNDIVLVEMEDSSPRGKKGGSHLLVLLTGGSWCAANIEGPQLIQGS